MSINVAAEGETYVQALGGFKDDASGEGEAVAAIGFGFVSDRYAGEVGQLVASATVVAQELVVPSNAGVGLPLSAVVAIQGLGIGNEAIAQLSAQGVVGCAFQIGADCAAVLMDARTMSEAVVQCCEGTALHYAMLFG